MPEKVLKTRMMDSGVILVVAAGGEVFELTTTTFDDGAVIYGYQLNHLFPSDQLYDFEFDDSWVTGAWEDGRQLGNLVAHVVQQGATVEVYQYGIQGPVVWFPGDARPTVDHDGTVQMRLHETNNEAAVDVNARLMLFLWYKDLF